MGVNAASMLPYSPLRDWVMGNEQARDPKKKANSEQVAEMKHLLREGIEAGAFGFSATFSPANRDYDGGYLPTHVAPREEFLEMASVLADYNRGSLEWTIGKHLERLGMDFLLELAKTSGRPVNFNAVAHSPQDPDGWRKMLPWTEKACRKATVLAVKICVLPDGPSSFYVIARDAFHKQRWVTRRGAMRSSATWRRARAVRAARTMTARPDRFRCSAGTPPSSPTWGWKRTTRWWASRWLSWLPKPASIRSTSCWTSRSRRT
jgi:N-acyl-D-aspartate/D-glutamate deacylase